MEEIVEQVVDCACVGNGGPRKQDAIAIGVVAAVCFFGGSAFGHYLTKRNLQKKYEDLATKEITEAKAYYARLNKAEPYDTPGGALEALGERGREAADAVLAYRGETPESEAEPVAVVEEETTIKRTNIFTEAAKADWDQDQEQSKRDAHPDEPFILHHDEWVENEPDYQQVSLTYYAEDDVLCDEKEQPIPSIDETVGEDNLTRFGHGSQDNRMLYVQNDRIQMMFEIIKNEGSYAETVAGYIKHEDRPRIMKMRGERN